MPIITPPPTQEPKVWQIVVGIGGITIILLFLFVLGVIGVFKGAPNILHQHEALTTWKPAEAQVMDAEIGPKSSPRDFRARIFQFIDSAVSGEEYVVWVSYRYKVGGKEYVSGKNKPWPWNIEWDLNAQPSGKQWTGQVGSVPEASAMGPDTWARKTLAGFVPGKPCQAYFDPNDPSKSFLLKEHDFSPYRLSLISLILMLLMMVLLMLIFEACWYNPNPVPIPRLTFFVWFRLILAFGYAGASGWVLVHYWVHASEPLARGWSPIGWAIASGLLSVLSCAAFGAHAYWLHHRRTCQW